MTSRDVERPMARTGSRRASAAVAALGALLTLSLAGLWLHEADQRRQAAVAHDAASFRARLASRVSDVERTLLGFVGFLGASDSVTPQDFANYHSRVLGPIGGPGWRAVAYMPETDRAQLPDLRRRLENARPLYAAVGYPSFELGPDHDGALLFPVVLAEPPDARKGVFGYDLASSPERLAAAGRARETGGVAVSEPVRLSQDAADSPYSLLLVAAVERADAGAFPPMSRGLVAAGLTPAPILAGLLEEGGGAPTRVRLSRGVAVIESKNDVASSSDRGALARWMAASPGPVSIGGSEFELDYAQLRGVPAADLAALGAILTLGFAATGFAFAFTRKLETTSAVIAAELERRSAELRRAERLAAEDRRVAALGRLVGGVAQNFNNLLTVIIGNLDILREQPGHPERDAIESETMDAANRGAAVTRQLLAYGGRAALRPKAVYVNDVLEHAAAVARSVAPASISVVSEPAPGDLMVKADPNALAGALLDLVVNARDAMPSGGILTLSAERVVEPSQADGVGAFVAIRVTDTGEGVAPENHDAIFEPFFTTKPVGAGSGLGLSAAMGFARQSGGSMRAESAPGGGARLVIKLPLEEAAGARAGEAPPALRNIGSVLLVEDDELVRRTVSAQLQRLGYSVETATDGREALKILADGLAPDLLVTDVVMPGGVSGAELARRLRLERPDLPTLFISGYPRSDLMGEHEIPEDAPLLMKPFRISELKAFLERHAV